MKGFSEMSAPVPLGYATNVFRSESLDEVVRSIDGPFARLRKRLGEQLSGLELRLGLGAIAETMASAEAKARLVEALRAAELSVLTINGFSPRNFHGRAVKEEAYRPTWLDEGRLDYTKSLAALFSELLPEGGSGAISTSPGSFKAFGHDAETLDGLARAFARMALSLADTEAATGRSVVLSIEPEPGCTIENTEEAVSFFENHLARDGARFLREARGLTSAAAEELLRRYLGITFDTCHLSIEFEDLVASADRYAAAGIRIGKVHATSAIRIERPRENREAVEHLRAFARSPYLHQVIGRDRAGAFPLQGLDLETVLADPKAFDSCEEIRIHFHLPLFAERIGPLSTTVRDTTACLARMVERRQCPVAILETYTWSVLEHIEEFRGMEIEEGIARELEWARERLLPTAFAVAGEQRGKASGRE